MDVWDWVLFAAAGALALRTLVGLMTRHKQEYLQQLAVEERVRRKAEAKAKQRQETSDKDREAAA